MPHQPFLDKVAGHLLKHYPGKMHMVCVVLPSRRGAIFLKKNLSERLENPAFAPAIFAIEDFVFELSELHLADNLVLLWDLYSEYKLQQGENAKSFEEFLKWGQILLNDFEDIDMHLVDAHALFNYLSEAKTIENWNLGTAPLSSKQKQYLDFYRSLGALYEKFRAKIIAQKSVYKGLAFRLLSEFGTIKIAAASWNTCVFAGFSTLCAAEQKIIRSMEPNVKVEMLFDADQYYISDEHQEAGKDLRGYFKNYNVNEFKWVDTLLAGTPKNITLTGVSGNIGQVKFARQLLARMADHEINQTALVLNDETLLIPLLHALPPNISELNITMGYPLSLTPAYEMIDSLITMHLHAIGKIQNMDMGVVRSEINLKFYFRDLLRVLRHPYIYSTGLAQIENYAAAINHILSSGKTFITCREVVDYFNVSEDSAYLLTTILQGWSDVHQAVHRMATLIDLLREHWRGDNNQYHHTQEILFIYQLSLVINKLKQLLTRSGTELTLKGLQLLIKTQCSSIKIPFVGEPLSGLQVMGMLETRALDFRNIIMLSVNEGVLPTGKRDNSFITFDIRREFGLPVYSDKEAIFAYHFYRLLQRSENVHFIYNTLADALGGGERSRYLMQIKHELLQKNPSVNYTEQLHMPEVEVHQINKAIVVKKNTEVMNQLFELAERGLSPTGISTFISCPLKFYFSQILKIGEGAVTLDEMDAATFGDAVHNALKELYVPLVGKPLDLTIIRELQTRSHAVLLQEFSKRYAGGELDYGKNHLMLKVAASFIRRFLKLEQKWIISLSKQDQHLYIDSIEHLFGNINSTSIQVVQPDGSMLKIKIKGRADRIDRFGGKIRVIDFKTGDVKKEKLQIRQWDDLLTKPEYDKALQLAIYGWLYSRHYNSTFPDSGIISFRLLKEEFIRVRLPADQDDPLKHIESVLTKIITQIYDASVPFEQTKEQENCKFCTYKGVCSR